MAWWEGLAVGTEVVLLSISMGVGEGKRPRLARSSATALITVFGNPMLLLVDLSGRSCSLAFAGVPEVSGTQCRLLGVERGARRSALVRGGIAGVG